LGLIVNEALVNSVKYAHPAGVSGFVTVSCRPLYGDSLLVSIEDDGVGLPPHLGEKGGGLGLRIMRSLAEELGGTLTFRSSPLGLTVQVVVPV
jgi:two-component sensor histidine kinase